MRIGDLMFRYSMENIKFIKIVAKYMLHFKIRVLFIYYAYRKIRCLIYT